ncbi:MAG TPA: hypothetical protein PLE74_12320 [Candidatus Cloacimonadota bacterium]|nr:hypothetical protein [Candidatus Cloacimonadota bacterium]
MAKQLVDGSENLSESEKTLVHDEVLNAIIQTRAHIAQTRINFVDKSSPIIANIWLRTSLRLKRIRNGNVQDLASTIEQKSRYWADPQNYNLRNIIEYKMRLEEVETALKTICR